MKQSLLALIVGSVLFSGCVSSPGGATTALPEPVQTAQPAVPDTIAPTTTAKVVTTAAPATTHSPTTTLQPTTTQPPTTTLASTPATLAQPTAVVIKDYSFNPSALTVKVGTTVTWMNQDSAPHTVTSDSGSEIASQTL